MALSTKTGTFLMPAATGSQAITGVGFTPKVIIFWSCAMTATGAGTGHIIGFGFAASATQRAATACASQNDSTTPSVAKRRHVNDKCLTLINATGPTVLGEADLTSFDADGFTLNWTTAPGTQRYWHYLALGGADLTNAAVIQITSPTSTGNQSYTGVGFQPDAILTQTTGDATAPNVTSAYARWGVGFAKSATVRAACSNGSDDALATSDTERKLVSTKCIALVSPGADFLAADLVSMDADGFTLNWTTVQASARYCWVLCLKGGQYHVGTETQKTSTGTKATTGVGFIPTGLFAASVAGATSTSVVDHARVCIGAASAAGTENNVACGDRDAVNPLNNSRVETQDKILTLITEGGATPTTNAAADLSSFDADGFTLDWTTADATAREFCYFAVGSSGAAADVVPPPLVIVRDAVHRSFNWCIWWACWWISVR